jgi:F0F1-type ATP synthase beta subunit
MSDTATAISEGRILSVIGPVIDVEFPPDGLPDIHYAIEFDSVDCCPCQVGRKGPIENG